MWHLHCFRMGLISCGLAALGVLETIRVGPGAGGGPSPAASLANTLLSQPSTSSSHCPGRRTEVRSSQLQLRSSRRLTSSHLLELQQEGALVLAPAVLLHALFDELVQDGGDGLRADPLQQLQLGTERYIKGFSRLFTTQQCFAKSQQY